jgi:mRNA interferase MazF
LKLERYGIYWANLDPVIGAEINKIRPVVVISDDMMNTLLQTVVVCPMTSSIHRDWRSRIQILIQGNESEIAVDQIRTISRKRMTSKIGKLSTSDAVQLRRLISEMYGESLE